MVQAIDNACKEHQGEFIKNAKIYVRDNGKKVKVVGDIWGEVTTNANIIDKTEFKTGDSVLFKKGGKGKYIQGKIIGLTPNKVIVEDYNKKTFEVNYQDVTKSN